MKSNVCKIEKGTGDLDIILRESQKVAQYNDLDHKQTMQLRLLCEELDGMLPNIIDDFDGDFWIEFAEGICQLHVSVKFDEFTVEKKEALINVSTNKKNAAAVGIVGKIRSGFENIFLNDDACRLGSIMTSSVHSTAGYSEAIDFSCIWSLEQYRNSVNKETQAEAWDELEKSVIASIADDVIVGIKGKQAHIIVVKKFA